jgi:hypothetical protein
MKILIDIDLENDAFQFDPNYELWAILGTWTDRVCHEGAVDMRLHDENGNGVGRVTVFETDDEFDKGLTL